MTDEQINLAIHKAVGFEWNDERKLWERHANKARVVSHKPFYYSSDLNLMHEAEQTITPKSWNNFSDKWWDYHNNLQRVSDGRAIHATARERAEAFLRTISKWEEAQK